MIEYSDLSDSCQVASFLSLRNGCLYAVVKSKNGYTVECNRIARLFALGFDVLVVYSFNQVFWMK